MSGFTAEKTFTHEFDGDMVTYRLKAPTIKFMQQLAPFIQQSQEGEDATFGVSIENLSKFGDILNADVVLGFEGLTDMDGAPVALETVTSQLYFAELVKLVITDLFSMTNMDTKDEKKPEGM